MLAAFQCALKIFPAVPRNTNFVHMLISQPQVKKSRKLNLRTTIRAKHFSEAKRNFEKKIGKVMFFLSKTAERTVSFKPRFEAEH